MRRPFARLMEMCRDLEDESATFGELSDRWGEPIPRIMDAMDANKVVAGEPGYV